MDQGADILQIAKCFAAEERNKAEQARKILEENNAEHIQAYDNVKTSLLNAIGKLHGQHTPLGPIDVLIQDKGNTICFISIGNKKFSSLDVSFTHDRRVKDRYTGIRYEATFWGIDSNCDLQCHNGWSSISHTERCKLTSTRYGFVENLPSMISTIGYQLSKWLL